MEYSDAKERIWNHAGLPSDSLRESSSFTWQLENTSQTEKATNLVPLVNDIVNCLDIANRELNGPVPSDSTSQNTQVIVDLAYSMSGILTRGIRHLTDWTAANRFDAESRGLLTESLCLIAFAWEQVLAGDIDDLRQEYEHWMATK